MHGPSCPGAVSSLTRDQIHISCAGGQILNHWITREDPEGTRLACSRGNREASVAGAGWTEEYQRLDQRGADSKIS